MATFDIILFIFAAITIGVNVGHWIYERRKWNVSSKDIEEFEKKKKEVISLIEKDRKDFEERESKKALETIELKKRELEQQRSFYSQQENQLLLNYEEKKNQVNEKIEALQTKLTEAVEKQAKIEAEQIQSTMDYYAQERASIDTDFNNFKAEIQEKLAILKENLRKEEARQQEIIEEYKRAEQIKQNKDFYRIVLSENAQQDVAKLRHIADELHDPSVLYKLIYKTYYERPFNEMVGRVVTGRGNTGIYKITNLENGRVYIGQTRQTFKERWRTHLKRGIKAEPGTQNKLYNAMWEEGAENFTFEVLSECSADELNTKEREFISLYHANTWGYNSTS